MLNALLETIVEIGMANTSLTIFARMENCEEFIFLQTKKSRCSSPSTTNSFKYLYNSFFLSIVSFSLKCFLKGSTLTKYSGISAMVDASH